MEGELAPVPRVQPEVRVPSVSRKTLAGALPLLGSHLAAGLDASGEGETLSGVEMRVQVPFANDVFG